MIDNKIPYIATVIDSTYNTTIAAGTAAGTITLLQSIILPYEILGWLIGIENYTDANNDVKLFCQIDGTLLPSSPITYNNPSTYSKEDRIIYMHTPIYSQQKLDLYIVNNTIPVADINAIGRVLFWYIEESKLAHFKDDPNICQMFDVHKKLRSVTWQ